MTQQQLPEDAHKAWEYWSHYVLKMLERAEERSDQLANRLRQVESEQAVLKTKLALYGVVGATVLAGVAEVIRVVIE